MDRYDVEDDSPDALAAGLQELRGAVEALDDGKAWPGCEGEMRNLAASIRGLSARIDSIEAALRAAGIRVTG